MIKAWLYHNKVARLAAMIIIAAILTELTFSTIQTLQFIRQPTVVSEVSVKLPTVLPVKTSDDISRLHLFGNEKINSDQLPETQLAVIVKGIFSTVPARDATAAIVLGEGKEKLIHLGEVLTNGAIVSAIFPDHIVLNYHGELQSLSLKRTFTPSSPRMRGSRKQRGVKSS